MVGDIQAISRYLTKVLQTNGTIKSQGTAKQENQLERKSVFFRLLLDVTKAITASLNTKEVFDLMVTKIPEVIQVDAATIRLLDPSGKKKEGIHSILVAPIPIRGKVSGVLRLLSRTRREFDSLEVELVAALAEQCGIALENAIDYQKLTDLLKECRSPLRI
jgi:GAF domain-containing protein